MLQNPPPSRYFTAQPRYLQHNVGNYLEGLSSEGFRVSEGFRGSEVQRGSEGLSSDQIKEDLGKVE